MNSLNLELEEVVEPGVLPEDPKLSQTQNIALRLIAAGWKGLKTADLFRKLLCTNYTARISELRQQGHIIEAEKIGGASAQWIYRWKGYTGGLDTLPKPLADAVAKLTPGSLF